MTAKPKRKRRVMQEFQIDEISVVDFPAQEGAVMTLMKRREPEPQERKEPLPMTTIEERARELRKQFNLSFTAAMRKARLEMRADDFEKARRAPYAADTPAPSLSKDADYVALENRVDEIAARDGITKLDAYRKARRTAPELVKALRGPDAPLDAA